MKIQKLIYFMAVANSLSFTKAAESCHIAQTAMSRNIAALEYELGVKLFERDNRNVSLTEEGKEFYWHAAHIVEIYRDAIEQIDIVVRKSKYNLRLGIGPYESSLLAPFLRSFRKFFPQINLSCQQFNYEQLSTHLTNGTIDVMFCIDHCAFRVTGAEYFTIYDGPWGIISESGHRFASRGEVSHSDLTGETIVTMSEYNFYDYKKNIEDMGGFPENYVRVNTFAAKVLFVQAGLGVGFVPRYVKNDLGGNVNYTMIKEEAYSKFLCAYQSGKRNHFFVKFLEHVREQAGLLRGTDYY